MARDQHADRDAVRITTATYGSSRAPAMSTQRSQPSPTRIAATKQTVRIAIEMT